MNTFVLEKWDDECPKTVFYIVRFENEKESETDKFINEIEQIAEQGESLQQLLSLLFTIIGEKFGAIVELFNRDENKAMALPPRPDWNTRRYQAVYIGNDLRLFCLRLSDEVVVLFGGGVKTAQTAQGSGKLGMKLYEAHNLQKSLTRLGKRGT